MFHNSDTAIRMHACIQLQPLLANSDCNIVSKAQLFIYLPLWPNDYHLQVSLCFFFQYFNLTQDVRYINRRSGCLDQYCLIIILLSDSCFFFFIYSNKMRQFGTVVCIFQSVTFFFLVIDTWLDYSFKKQRRKSF